MNYDAVFWDIGGVIVDLESIRDGHEAFIQELAATYDVEYERSLNQWREELGTYFREREGTTYRTARDGYHLVIESIVGHEVPESEWGPMYAEASGSAIRPVDGVVEALEGLDDAGVYQAVISDIDTAEAERILGQFGVWDLFDHVTTSEEVGHTKPNPRMFDTALEKAGGRVDPADALMIGDRYEHDVQGGKRAGLTTVALGDDADGPDADYRVKSPRELLGIVGVEN